jgi:2-keto-4-pentenoate hydratase/2-oxohepta-3-ene-1,7-dioic acid hydratase in catechol pathway
LVTGAQRQREKASPEVMMKLASYFAGEPRIGIADPPDLWDLRDLFSLYLFETERTPHHRALAERLVPGDMALFIRLHHGRLEIFQEAFDFMWSQRQRITASIPKSTVEFVRPLADTRLLPPVMAPTKIVCCGSSYASYLEEFGLPKSKWPQDVKISFLKPPTALIGQGDTILFPPDSEKWDYENELAIVIGRTCSDIGESEADKYIFGYSILNDVCVRDIPEWTGGYECPRGKACDTLAPFGPWIAPAQYLDGDPNDLRLVTTVDGEVRQDARTSGLMWSIQRIVAFISRYIKLVPGDVIATGSAPGNALSGSGEYLKVGQLVRCEMEGIGVLENKVGVKSWSSKLPPMPPTT